MTKNLNNLQIKTAKRAASHDNDYVRLRSTYINSVCHYVELNKRFSTSILFQVIFLMLYRTTF